MKQHIKTGLLFFIIFCLAMNNMQQASRTKKAIALAENWRDTANKWQQVSERWQAIAERNAQ